MDYLTPDWCSLPEHLLAMIAERLPTRMDIERFRAVCSAFRISSVSPPPKPFSPYPDLDLEYYPTNGSNYYKLHLEITESTFYAVEPLPEISNLQQSTKEALLLRADKSSSGKLRIHNLLCKKILNLPITLNLLDCRVEEISKGYRAELVTKTPWGAKLLFDKVCISSDDECALMAVINNQLFMWKGGNKEGTKIDIDVDIDYVSDIIYHNKKFYICCDTRVLTVHPELLKVTEVVMALPPPPGYGYIVNEHFVRLSNHLFFINEYRHPGECGPFGKYIKLGSSVFKLDEENQEWIPVKGGWEDRALFLWEECSFFLSTKQFFGLESNCIYRINKDRAGYMDAPLSVFNLKDGTFEKLYPCPVPAWLFPEGKRLFPLPDESTETGDRAIGVVCSPKRRRSF